jgi:hypothetical protein
MRRRNQGNTKKIIKQREEENRIMQRGELNNAKKRPKQHKEESRAT